MLKIKKSDMKNIYDAKLKGKTIKELAEEYGVSASSISVAIRTISEDMGDINTELLKICRNQHSTYRVLQLGNINTVEELSLSEEPPNCMDRDTWYVLRERAITHFIPKTKSKSMYKVNSPDILRKEIISLLQDIDSLIVLDAVRKTLKREIGV